MCSNKNWYYSLNLNGASCTGAKCTINARSKGLPLSTSVWWPASSTEQQLFAVKPTVCNRDYEHLVGPYVVYLLGEAWASPSRVVAIAVQLQLRANHLER